MVEPQERITIRNKIAFLEKQISECEQRIQNDNHLLFYAKLLLFEQQRSLNSFDEKHKNILY